MTGKALLNYTTKVAPSKTAGEVQAILAKAGAKAIGTEYEDGEPVALHFVIATVHGDAGFLLPINVEPVAEVLERQVRQGKINTRHGRPNPKAVAWRIVKDWIEAQLAIIETEMVTLDQVMLPYRRTSDGTPLYKAVESGALDRVLALGAGS